MTKNRRQRGNALLFLVVGIAVIALGVFVKGQPWTTPEMFAPLGLDIGKTIVGIGFFLLFVPVIKIYFYSPLKEAIDERDNKLEATFAEAEGLKSRMEELRGSYEQKLAASEAEARAKIQTAIQEAQTMKESIIAEAKGQAEEIRAKAMQDLDRERAKIMTDLRAQAVDLTLIATEKLIGASMDENRQRELAKQFIETAEVGR